MKLSVASASSHALLAGMMLVVASVEGLAGDLDKPTRDDTAMFADCLDKVDPSSGSAEACIGSISERCMELSEGASTLGMNACFRRETRLWDDMLNRDYQAIRKSQPGEEFTNLRDVQRAWIAFRDLKCRYPYVAIKGTLASTLAASCMNTETARRAIDLMQWRQMLGPQ